MYKLLFLFCLTFNIYAGASSWQEYWIKAVEQCDQRDHLEAIKMFNLAVANMEEINDLNHPHVYVDRARLNLLLENNELAIEDLNKALDNPNLSKKEISRATVSRVIAKSRLGMEQEVLDDLKLFSENTENKPVIEETSENIIIRNIPDCPCYQNIMTFYYIDSGICTSEKDIQKLKSNIWIIKRACRCGCSSNKDVNYNACDSITCGVQNNQGKIGDCKTNCNRAAILGAGWCAKVFKSLACQTACLLAVNELQIGCYWCCEDNGFYERCIRPFENIAKYIQAPCDPYWD